MRDPVRKGRSGPPRSGQLEGLSFAELLWGICRTGVTGVLTVDREGLRRDVHIDSGNVVFATTADLDERLGVYLLRSGAIGVGDLEDALTGAGRETRIGRRLIEAGAVDEETLAEAVRAQVRAIVLGLFDWRAGSYSFEEGPLPGREEIRLDEHPAMLVLQGNRQSMAITALRERVGPLGAVYGLAPDWQENLRDLELTDGEDLLVERLRCGDDPVETLCREVFLSNFEIYQALWGLCVLGVVARRPRRAELGDVQREGNLQQEDFAAILARLGREGASGVLYVDRGDRGRAFHFEIGSCVFATSNDVEDGLLAHLLRRGIISLEDREEVERQLLTNRRVGTLLCERGAIDSDDLENLVGQQLLEIVHDTFRWEAGEIAFVPGATPTMEQIRIDQPVEALVTQGLRQVDSWRRVLAGCAGLDSILELTPSYLDTLDRMNAGPDEWELVTGLGEGRTVRELCAQSAGDDFRVCQTLWALRVLDAVRVTGTRSAEVVPAVETETETEIEVVLVDGSDAPSMDAETPEEDVDPVVAESAHVSDLDEHSGEADLAPDEPDHLEESPGELPPTLAAGAPRETAAAVYDADEAGLGETAPPAIAAAEVNRDHGGVAEPPRFVAVPSRSAGFQPSPPIEEPLPDTAPPAIEATEPEVRPESQEAPGAGIALSDDAEAQHDRVAATVSEDEVGSTAPPGVPLPPRMDWNADPEATQPLCLDELRSAWDTEETGPEPAQSAEAAEADAVAEVAEPLPDDATGFGEPVQPVYSAEAEVEAVVDGADDLDDAWEPATDLERTIGRFNAIQRVVFQAVRAEVGAAAVNFIRSCCDGLPEDAARALREIAIQPDGSWEQQGLVQDARTRRIDDPWPGYRTLIERELELLRIHLGEVRTGQVERQIEQVDRIYTALPPV